MTTNLRLARRRELDSIARVIAAAFRHESYMSFLHPNETSEKRTRKDMTRFWRQQIRPKLFDDRYRVVVCVDDQDNIVAAAVWMIAHSPMVKKLGLWPCIGRCINGLDKAICRDRSLDRMRVHAFKLAVSFFEGFYPHGGQFWELQTLGVYPSKQRGGFGKTLVEWGAEHAGHEGVPAVTICSDGSEEFYRKCGFTEKIGNITEGAGNPLAEVKGGDFLLCKP